MPTRIVLAALLAAPAVGCFNPSGGATTDPPPDTASTDASATSGSSTSPVTDGPTSTGTTAPDTTAGTTSLDPTTTSTASSSTTAATTAISVCGDGVLGADEECDDGNLDNTDACLDNCVQATCGDGVVCPGCGEQCDDGNILDGDNCSDCKYEKVLRVFVSTADYSAQGLTPTMADNACMQLGNFYYPGTFVGWIGDVNSHPRDRLGDPTLPYVRTDGVLVATDREDLLDGTLKAPINVDAAGAPILVGNEAAPCVEITNYVWTGTHADGTNEDPDCYDWSTMDVVVGGRVGNILAMDGGWSDKCIMPCAVKLRIYCIQTS